MLKHKYCCMISAVQPVANNINRRLCMQPKEETSKPCSMLLQHIKVLKHDRAQYKMI